MATIKMKIDMLFEIPIAGARKIKSKGNPQPIIIKSVCLSIFIIPFLKVIY
jgi:hypothetical protein